MPNHFVNPLINDYSTFTFIACSDCLDYLMESLDATKSEELSLRAKQGVCNILECIKQAIDFEGDRADLRRTDASFTRRLDAFERALVIEVNRQLADGEEEVSIVPQANKYG